MKTQKQIVENYIKAYNDFDTKAMVADLHEDVVFENVSGEAVTLRTEGVEAFKAQAEEATQYFTQRQQQIESWDLEDDKVIIQIRYKAVLASDLPNGMKAGDTLELQGSSEFDFKEGKIIKLTDKS